GCSNRSKIHSVQKCYLCLRYVVSPMSPGRTLKKVVGAKGFEPSTSWSRTRRASQAALRPDVQPLRPFSGKSAIDSLSQPPVASTHSKFSEESARITRVRPQFLLCELAFNSN